MTTEHKGRVILAGAGPGDPELITLKTLKYLQQAEILLVDRLVSEDLLSRYVNTRCEIIRVGKQRGKGTSTSQQEINRLLVHYAEAGHLVVRLKGGDVSIFSNILDELFALRAAGIDYEIVPGVTAALGAAAYLGIPLTARRYSTAVRFLTYYEDRLISPEQWKELAGTSDTLVFYMSSTNLHEVIGHLKAAMSEKDKPVAIVEQATTPLQHLTSTTIKNYENEIGSRSFRSPALVIIGDVVSLHSDLGWFKAEKSDAHYFPPLAKLITTEFVNERKTKRHATRA